MRLLLLSVLALTACEARQTPGHPGILSLTVNWEVPSQRENEEALDPKDIKGYNVQYRSCNGSDWMPAWQPGGNTAMDFELPRGCYEFRVNAQDVGGLTSPWSPVIRSE